MNNSDFEIQNGILVKYHGSETEVIIPEAVTAIANEAFRGCKGIRSIVIPKTVAAIGAQVFLGCQSLKNISIPGGVQCRYACIPSRCKITRTEGILPPREIKPFMADIAWLEMMSGQHFFTDEERDAGSCVIEFQRGHSDEDCFRDG